MQNGYQKLRQLLCEEEEIRNDLLELRETTEEGYEVIIKDEQELELRHILWYMRIKLGSQYLNRDINIGIHGILFRYDECMCCKDTEVEKYCDVKISFSLPLSSQDEVCERIYNYLITL